MIYMNKEYVPPMIIEARGQVPTADINRLNAMITNLNAANDARARSMEIAMATAAMARYPFVAERLAEALAAGSAPTQVIVVPPYIRVLATMSIEGRSAAMLDIEGEPSGKIFRVGDRFAERKGRITRITPERITVVYENKEFTYTP